MRPLIIFEIPSDAYDSEMAEKFDKYLQENLPKDYDALVIYGDVRVRVYNIPFLAKLYYKIKSWFILHLMKKHVQSKS
jgi:hypothetical protein